MRGAAFVLNYVTAYKTWLFRPETGQVKKLFFMLDKHTARQLN